MLLIINFIFYFQSGRSRGFAFVYFKNVDDAIEVMYRLRLQPLYFSYFLFDLMLNIPANSYGHVGTLPPFYGTFTQN